MVEHDARIIPSFAVASASSSSAPAASPSAASVPVPSAATAPLLQLPLLLPPLLLLPLPLLLLPLLLPPHLLHPLLQLPLLLFPLLLLPLLVLPLLLPQRSWRAPGCCTGCDLRGLPPDWRLNMPAPVPELPAACACAWDSSCSRMDTSSMAVGRRWGRLDQQRDARALHGGSVNTQAVVWVPCA